MKSAPLGSPLSPGLPRLGESSAFRQRWVPPHSQSSTPSLSISSGHSQFSYMNSCRHPCPADVPMGRLEGALRMKSFWSGLSECFLFLICK